MTATSSDRLLGRARSPTCRQRKETGGRVHCVGRSRGGLTTKIHALGDARGLPIELLLIPGQAHDLLGADTRLIGLGDGDVFPGNEAYVANWLRQRIETQGAAPKIPDRSNRKAKQCFSMTLYKKRNRVERFFNKIKRSRRVATRFEKHAQNCLAMIKLASIGIWKRHNEFRAE